jgi:hypothetical protein
MGVALSASPNAVGLQVSAARRPRPLDGGLGSGRPMATRPRQAPERGEGAGWRASGTAAGGATASAAAHGGAVPYVAGHGHGRRRVERGVALRRCRSPQGVAVKSGRR